MRRLVWCGNRKEVAAAARINSSIGGALESGSVLARCNAAAEREKDAGGQRETVTAWFGEGCSDAVVISAVVEGSMACAGIDGCLIVVVVVGFVKLELQREKWVMVML
ncbi:hypothetical protein M0R45_007000 [Rubus argutus]|uniref:Uncharacterized protein n=1 Tax=Rubus argutus TaxID=59490 RepID=A0AAW1YSW4_RUBAR